MSLNHNLLLYPADQAADVVAADLEGTLSAGATWTGLRRWLEANGQKRLFRQFMRQRLWPILKFRLGLIKDARAFKEQWVLDMFRLFAGYSEAEFNEVADFVVEQELWPQRRQAVAAEFLAHRLPGRRLIIVTGVNEPVLARFARKLGEGVEAIGTPLHFEAGVFTGEIVGRLNTGAEKVTQLRPFTRHGRIVAAYGDTAADIPMLEMAQEPVAVFPDAGLQETAVAAGWRIIREA